MLFTSERSVLPKLSPIIRSWPMVDVFPGFPTFETEVRPGWDRHSCSKIVKIGFKNVLNVPAWFGRCFGKIMIGFFTRVFIPSSIFSIFLPECDHDGRTVYTTWAIKDLKLAVEITASSAYSYWCYKVTFDWFKEVVKTSWLSFTALHFSLFVHQEILLLKPET